MRETVTVLLAPVSSLFLPASGALLLDVRAEVRERECVCVYVYLRLRERERDSERERQ